MRGFTIIELVVAMAMLLAITAGMFTAIQMVPDRGLVMSESADMQQRIRVAIDTIVYSAMSASSLTPRRWGGPSEDPAGTFKSDTVTFANESGTTTYWLKADSLSDAFQLMRWMGGSSPDVPVVDHVVGLRFVYFGDAPDALVDASLSGMRSMDVTVRVEAAVSAARGTAGPSFVRAGSAHTARRWAPDLAMHVRVTPRNLNLDR
jgi:type II secretory pathway pseudopilin PulG